MSVRQRLGARRPANPPARDAESAPVTWLTAAELDSWLSLVRLMIWLPIDVLSSEQLRRVGLAADRITSRIDTSAINQ